MNLLNLLVHQKGSDKLQLQIAHALTKCTVKSPKRTAVT